MSKASFLIEVIPRSEDLIAGKKVVSA